MRPPIWVSKIYSCFPTCLLAKSLQLSRLEDDMRKLPSSTSGASAKRPDKSASPDQSSTRETSISATSITQVQSSGAFSVIQGESSATSAPEQLASPPLSALKRKKKRKALKKRRLPAKDLRGRSGVSDQRYWNEFDDGSEREQDEPYTIFVDPRSSNNFPGAHIVSNLSKSLIASLHVLWDNIQTILTQQAGQSATSPDERASLMDSNRPSGSPTIEDSSDSDDETAVASKRQSYSTMVSHHHHHIHTGRETMLFRSSIGSFAASLVFVTIAAILVGTGRRKAAAEVNIGLVICMAASAVSAIIGVGCTVSRRHSLHWAPKFAAIITLLLIVLANAAVLIGLKNAKLLN